MNRHTHATDEQLLLWKYGAAPQDDEFVACPICQARAEHLWQQRLAGLLLVSGQKLAEQRRAIWRRVEQPARNRWLSLPVAASSALALALLAGTAWHYHSPSVQEPVTVSGVSSTAADEELLSDVQALLETDTPLAAQPMQELFVE